MAGAITGLEGPHVALATLLIVVGRAVFALLYYTGIPFIRIPAFMLGSFGSAYLAVLLVLTGAL